MLLVAFKKRLQNLSHSRGIFLNFIQFVVIIAVVAFVVILTESLRGNSPDLSPFPFAPNDDAEFENGNR